MLDLSKPDSADAWSRQRRLAIAENDAALALKRSTDALQAWGDALVACHKGSGTADAAVLAEQRFEEAVRLRRDADDKLTEVRRALEGSR